MENNVNSVKLSQPQTCTKLFCESKVQCAHSSYSSHPNMSQYTLPCVEAIQSAITGVIEDTKILSKEHPLLMVEDILDPVLSFLEDYRVYLCGNVDTSFENQFEISTKENRFMCFTAEWLGRKFNSLKQRIIDRSEVFKRRHISCIDNLPPSEEIVQEVFPQCMVHLIMQWMEKAQQTEVARDHSYCENSPHRKKAKHEDHTAVDLQHEVYNEQIFSFVQLVLEFTNNCLISGVAHVVYPRLLESPT